MPQLALATSTASGKAAAARFRIATTTSEAPTPQFAPHAIGPGASSRWSAARSAGAIPIIVRPFVSKLSVQTTGRPVVSAPAIAASASSRADIVSIQSTSAPPRARLAACSANASLAASKPSVPTGAMISPVGPMLPGDDDLAPALVGDAAGNPRRRLVQFRDARFRPVQREPVTVAAEAVGENDVGARVDETAMQRGDPVGVRDVPQLRRVARDESLGEQVAARGAVGEEPRSGGQQSGEAIGHRGRSRAKGPGVRYPRSRRIAEPCAAAASRRAQRWRQACVVRSSRRVSSTWVIFTAADVATMVIAIAAAAAVKPDSSMLMIVTAASLVFGRIEEDHRRNRGHRVDEQVDA